MRAMTSHSSGLVCLCAIPVEYGRFYLPIVDEFRTVDWVYIEKELRLLDFT